MEDLEAESGAPGLADRTWMRADAFLLGACRPTSARLAGGPLTSRPAVALGVIQDSAP